MNFFADFYRKIIMSIDYIKTNLVVSYADSKGEISYWCVPDYLKLSEYYATLYSQCKCPPVYKNLIYGKSFTPEPEDMKNIQRIKHFPLENNKLVDDIVTYEQFYIVCNCLNNWNYLPDKLPDNAIKFLDNNINNVLKRMFMFGKTISAYLIMNHFKTLKLKKKEVFYYYFIYKQLYKDILQDLDFFIKNKDFINYSGINSLNIDEKDILLIKTVPAYVALLKGPFVEVFSTEDYLETSEEYNKKYPYAKIERRLTNETLGEEYEEFSSIDKNMETMIKSFVGLDTNFKYKKLCMFDHFTYNLLKCGRYFREDFIDITKYLKLFKDSGYKLNLDILFINLKKYKENFDTIEDIISELFIISNMLAYFYDDVKEILIRDHNWDNIKVWDFDEEENPDEFEKWENVSFYIKGETLKLLREDEEVIDGEDGEDGEDEE